MSKHPIQISRYDIKCNRDSWLAKKGLVIYVEKEYDSSINESLIVYSDTLHALSSNFELKFVYLPDFLSSCSGDLYEYMTGHRYSSYRHYFKHFSLDSILGTDVYEQLQGPSLLFTGLNQNGACDAYSIELVNTANWRRRIFGGKQYVLNLQSIKAIFKEYGQTHDVPLFHPAQSIVEDDIRFRYSDDDTPEIKWLDDESHYKTDSGVRFSLKIDRNEKFEEMELPSPFDDISVSEEEKIVRDKAQSLIEKLLDEGFSQEAIWAFFAPEQKFSTMTITEKYRIILPDYDNMEIPLPAVQKAVYFLFLKHPEGINFKDMVDYRDELLNIYRKLAQRGTTDKLTATVDDLVNPLSNAMNEKCSRIKNMFCYYLTDRLARHYYISGEKGERKRIGIESYNIKWEKEI